MTGLDQGTRLNPFNGLCVAAINLLECYIMAYEIADTCQRCGECVAVCPSEAILEGDPIFTIEADKCIDCGVCESTCPHGSIKPGA